jgi:glucose-6-phosphate isomerase
VTPAELVERIWAHDERVWTGSDEARWLGWLDEPIRLLARVDELLDLAQAGLADVDDVVLLGMGGSSLAPEVLRRAFAVERFHVLDTTHPQAIRALESRIDAGRTLFVVSSKSGGTIETRSHADYFWERSGGDPRRFLAITDPGSGLDELATERGFAVVHGEPTIGGRYSALSPFGIVPAALMGVDVARLLHRAEEMREACRLVEGNPGLELGLELGRNWVDGRDKVVLEAPSGFALWVEQLLAESTGKSGKGLVPIVEPYDGDDAQHPEIELPDPYELGQEFFRWEFATAVAGHLMNIDPFDQPDVQAAKDMTNEVLETGEEPSLESEGDFRELLASATDGDYFHVQAFVDPENEERLGDLVGALRATGRPVSWGLGPRYLHSTGQLHKGGPNTGLFVQVVDDLGEELPIPGRDFGFRRLFAAQAAGDFEALRTRGRRIVRLRLEDA